MSDELTVRIADTSIRDLRSEQIISPSGLSDLPYVAATEALETPIIGTSTAAPGKKTVLNSGATTLVAPANAARTCWIRCWEQGATPGTKRLFYRRDGVTPDAAGSNAENFMVHGEGRMLRLAQANWGNFKMIAETGSTFDVWIEWSNT